MFFLFELVAADAGMGVVTALVTDGRFSASRSPRVGYAYPGAMGGGPPALIEGVDEIEIDIPAARLDLVSAGDWRRDRDRRRRSGPQRVIDHGR